MALLLGLVGCGGSNGSGTATTAPTGDSEAARAELERTVRSYASAYFEGDADTVLALFSTRCRPRVASQVPEAVNVAKSAYPDTQITSVSIDEHSGDRARVTYRYSRPELDQEREAWVREGGQWRSDDC